jgi:hypothetical protein
MAGTAARRAVIFPMPDARSFATDEERQDAMAERGAAYLKPLLPQCAVIALVGGKRGYEQIRPSDRERLVHRALLVNPGSNGSTLLEAARVLLYIRGYARARGWFEDETWPISSTVAASMIEG